MHTIEIPFPVHTANKFSIFSIYFNFTSLISSEYKFVFLYTLFHWGFCLILNFSKFHMELGKINEIISKNSYPHKFIDKCISKFFKWDIWA